MRSAERLLLAFCALVSGCRIPQQQLIGGSGGASASMPSAHQGFSQARERHTEHRIAPSWTLDAAPKSDTPASVFNPLYNKAQVKAQLKARPKPLRIDSLCSRGACNGADSLLQKADALLRQYDQEIASRRKRTSTIFWVLTPLIGLDILVIILAASPDQNTNSLLLDLFLLLLLIVVIIVSAIIGMVLLFALLAGVTYSLLLSKRKIKQLRQQAIEYIRKAPSHAPESRRIEYELRSLRMLGQELTWPEAQSKILQIRRMMKDDPSNPWYDLLKQTAAELQIPWTIL
ncbi:MAG: hypothetical protein ACK5XN_02245 [Bacteroidota bacterium]|jgi:uncharacterized integral membrane protein